MFKKMPKFNCIECNSISSVSKDYLQFDYVKAQCCSVHCYHKNTGKKYKNTQEGEFELTI